MFTRAFLLVLVSLQKNKTILILNNNLDNLPEKTILSQGITIFLMIRQLVYKEASESEMSSLFS